MRRFPTGPLAGLTLLLAVAAVTGGCRQGTFVGDRYNNFRAYYNTFYNAQKAFDDGEEQLVRLDQPVDRSRFLPVFADVPAEATGPSSASGPFQNAIDKSADLLRERPDSKWADDALLLIGRSYFYQRNLVGAEGKFRETIAAAEEREQEALADEARYWLGRTLAAQDRYDEAVVVLEEGLARDGLSRYWRARMQLALAEQYVRQRSWDEAADALAAGLEDLRDADLAGRAHFLLGQVLEAKGDPDGAADAYAAVERYRPYYELLYAAQLSRALALGLDAGRHDEALALIRRMRRDDKNYAKRAEVELAHARLLAAAGRHEEARERFETLLYDADAFAGATVPRNEVHYFYGAFYRDQLNDYVRAAAFLDTAATGLRADPGREALLTRTALTGVRREADAFLDYAAIATELMEADSLLALGALNDEAFAARRAEIEAAQRRAWEEDQRRLAALRGRQGFTGGGVVNPTGSPLEGRGGATPTGGVGDAGFLGYRDVARVQEALVAFQAIWGDRPLVPNWRRRQAIGGAVVDEEMNVVGAQGAVPQGRSPGGPPPLDWANVPRDEVSRAVLLTERASLRYELGNVLFLSLAQPDSAAYWYSRVLEEDLDAPVAPRALYALGEVRREQGRTEEAEALYRRVLDVAPASGLAATARERLGLPPPEPEDAADAASRAAEGYAEAYGQWRRGEHAAAIRSFLDLAAAYSETEQAPRALLAAAVAFVEWAPRDTSAAGPGIPAALVPPALLDTLAAFEGVPVPADAPEATPAPVEGEAPVGGEQDAMEQLRGEAEPAEEGGRKPVPAEAESRPAALPDVEPAPVAEAEPESTPEADSVEVALEAVPMMSEAALPDGTVSDTTAALPPLRLMDLFSFIAARYPDTPYAARAQAHRIALQAPPEATDEGDPAAADGSPYGLEGGTPLDPALGGYTWRVATGLDPHTANNLLLSYLAEGLRAAVVAERSGEDAQYTIVLGQFASPSDAEAVREALPSAGAEGASLIVPLAGLTLIDPSELRRRADPR